MFSDPSSGECINLFSLVTYLPEPLAGFIDHLRQELVPGCSLRAHVTHLVPRKLDEPPLASSEIGGTLRRFCPFDLHLNEVEIFTITSVIYVALGNGFADMQNMHEALNTGAAQFNEPFPYHPHITLAQGISPAQVPGVFEHARMRWAACPHPRVFRVDRATFVQATRFNTWIDLDEYPLGG
ncbi:MAG TPA: 2'-5' RNA ligase family protein [Bryobacteraceae bacterium]|nr:2'-5' RNA ligase family protein [Bryobacteraceae bacterium]